MRARGGIGGHPRRALIKMLSLLQPRTPFGPSRLYLRLTLTPAICSTMSIDRDHLVAADIERSSTSE
jgi:hypothetical protein